MHLATDAIARRTTRLQQENGMSITAQQIAQLGKFERLQLAEDLWDSFAEETTPETDAAVLNELAHRATWRDTHPSEGKSLEQIALQLGVRL